MADGLNLMLYGMGTVFVFLALLVICTTAMSAMIMRFHQEQVIDTPVSGKKSGSQDQRIIAVIEAAIAAHRKSN